RDGIAGRVRDGDDGVVERSLHMHQPVRDVLAFLLLKLLRLALFVRCCGAACFSHGLCLRARFLLVGYRALARSLTGAGVGVGTLSPDRQAAAMAVPAIGTDFD